MSTFRLLVFVAALLTVAVVGLTVAVIRLEGENATLKQNLSQKDVTIASLQRERDQKELTLAEVQGQLETTKVFFTAVKYIADKAFSTLSNFIPEGSTIIVRTGFGVGDATLTFRGDNRSFEIVLFPPWPSGMTPTDPDGTSKWRWPINETQVMMPSPTQSSPLQ